MVKFEESPSAVPHIAQRNRSSSSSIGGVAAQCATSSEVKEYYEFSRE